MKIIILIFACLICISLGYGQQHKCGTNSIRMPQAEMQPILPSDSESGENEGNKVPKKQKNKQQGLFLHFKIQFHFLYGTTSLLNELKAQNQEDIPIIMKELNAFFEDGSIAFEKEEDNYISVNCSCPGNRHSPFCEYANIETSEDGIIQNTVVNDNCENSYRYGVINIYFFNGIKHMREVVSGLTPSNSLPSKNKRCEEMQNEHGAKILLSQINSIVLSHEIAHFLGLYHTFEERFGKGNGDFIDDTPPARNSKKATNLDDLEKDENGFPYIEGDANIMSYDKKRDHFTKDQFTRMRFFAQAYRECLLQNTETTGTSEYINNPNDVTTFALTFDNFINKGRGPNKFVLFSHKDTIAWCERMWEETLHNPNLRDLLKDDYAWAKFDIDGMNIEKLINDQAFPRLGQKLPFPKYPQFKSDFMSFFCSQIDDSLDKMEIEKIRKFASRYTSEADSSLMKLNIFYDASLLFNKGYESMRYQPLSRESCNYTFDFICMMLNKEIARYPGVWIFVFNENSDYKPTILANYYSGYIHQKELEELLIHYKDACPNRKQITLSDKR
jgi:hypothetical protein